MTRHGRASGGPTDEVGIQKLGMEMAVSVVDCHR